MVEELLYRRWPGANHEPFGPGNYAKGRREKLQQKKIETNKKWENLPKRNKFD
jgi:hypothetical protein